MALTVPKIIYSLNYPLRVLSLQPSLYLRLGESSGASALDSSGNGLTGSYVASPTLGVAGALSGDSNTAVTLNGTTQYVSVPDNALLDLVSPFTIEAWVKIAANPGAGTVFAIIDKGTSAYNLYIDENGKIGCSKPGVAVIQVSTAAVTLATWSHIVWTKSGAANKVYLNGVDVTGAVGNQTIAANATALTIGASAGVANALAGSLDEIAIYPAALSPANILLNYQTAQAQTFTFLYPPRKLPYTDIQAIRHDNIASSGVIEKIYERTDEFLTFEMEYAKAGADIASWDSFIRAVVQGSAFDYYPDSTLSAHSSYTLEQTNWTANYKQLGMYSFQMRFRLRVAWP